MKSIINVLYHYKDLITYTFFGVCTTAINIAVYNIFYREVQISNILSTIIAWFVAVIFAFITNKLFVFNSKSFEKNKLKHELMAFFLCRLLTGILDVGIMLVAVDCMKGNGVFWKTVSNIIVIILNYVASKIIIFKNK